MPPPNQLRSEDREVQATTDHDEGQERAALTRQILGVGIIPRNKTDADNLRNAAGLQNVPLPVLQSLANGLMQLDQLRDNARESATQLVKNEFVSDEGQKHLQRLLVATGGSTVKSQDISQLRAFVGQMRRAIPAHAGLNAEFSQFATLRFAREAFADVRVSTRHANAKEASTSQHQGLLNAKEFSALGLNEKRDYLAALREAMQEFGEDNPQKFGTVVALRQKLMADKRVPDSWQAWLASPEPDTPAYAAVWINHQLPQLLAQTQSWQALASKIRGNPAAANTLQQQGVVMPSVLEFQSLNRKERNRVLQDVGSRLASVDASLADAAAAAGLSDGATARAQVVQLQAEHDARQANTAAKAKQLAGQLAEAQRSSPVIKQLQQDFTRAEQHARRPSQAADVAANLTALRRPGAQGGGLWAALKARFAPSTVATPNAPQTAQPDRTQTASDHANQPPAVGQATGTADVESADRLTQPQPAESEHAQPAADLAAQPLHEQQQSQDVSAPTLATAAAEPHSPAAQRERVATAQVVMPALSHPALRAQIEGYFNVIGCTNEELAVLGQLLAGQNFASQASQQLLAREMANSNSPLARILKVRSRPDAEQAA